MVWLRNLIIIIVSIAIGAGGEYWFTHQTQQGQAVLKVKGLHSQNLTVGPFVLSGLNNKIPLNAAASNPYNTPEIIGILQDKGRSVVIHSINIYGYASDGALVADYSDSNLGRLSIGSSEEIDLKDYNPTNNYNPASYQIVITYEA